MSINYKVEFNKAGLNPDQILLDLLALSSYILAYDFDQQNENAKPRFLLPAVSLGFLKLTW